MNMIGGNGCRVWCERNVWCILGDQIYFLLYLFSYGNVSATIFVPGVLIQIILAIPVYLNHLHHDSVPESVHRPTYCFI